MSSQSTCLTHYPGNLFHSSHQMKPSEKFPSSTLSLVCIQYIKRATKLYFMRYLRVVIILFCTGLCKTVFSTCSFGKTRFSSFCVLVFRVTVSLALNF